MKVENEKILKSRCKLSKAVNKNKKQCFSAIVNMAHKLKKVEDKHPVFNVYAIASKIANGMYVTPEELNFIRKCAPALLEDAERKRDKKEVIKGI